MIPRYEAADIDAHEENLPRAFVGVLRLSLTGKSYIEIAEAEGIKVGTVKSRLNRARLALANLMADDAQQDRIDKNNDAAESDRLASEGGES